MPLSRKHPRSPPSPCLSALARKPIRMSVLLPVARRSNSFRRQRLLVGAPTASAVPWKPISARRQPLGTWLLHIHLPRMAGTFSPPLPPLVPRPGQRPHSLPTQKTIQDFFPMLTPTARPFFPVFPLSPPRHDGTAS